MAEWIEEELKGSDMADERLALRLGRVVEQLSASMGQSIPMACQDWAATKAAYRFFDNPRVNGVLPATVRSGFRRGVSGADARGLGSRAGSPAVSDN